MIKITESRKGELGYLTDHWLRLSARYLYECMDGDRGWIEEAEKFIKERKLNNVKMSNCHPPSPYDINNFAVQINELEDN